MRNNFLKILLFLVGLITEVTGQGNIFTAGGNGDFETTNSVSDFKFSSGTGTLTRVSAPSFSGTYAMKCNPNPTQSTISMNDNSTGLNGILTGHVRLRIYVPSNSTLNSNAEIRLGSNINCSLSQTFKVGTSPYNTWIEIKNIQNSFAISITNVTTSGEFYIDKIEAYPPPIVNAGAVVNQSTSSISLNPTYIGTNIFGAFSFSYEWNDGSTLKDRVGLAVGNYSVYIKVSLPSCPGTLWFQYAFTIYPPPPCVAPIQICVNGQGSLIAGCVLGSVKYYWWTAPTGGTLTGGANASTSGAVLLFAASSPGIYKLYVESEVNGVKSLTRTEGIVTVLPNFTPAFAITPSAPYYPNKPLTFATAAPEVVNYNYTFGDGSTLVAANGAQHTYTAPGNYPVSIIATAGCTTTPFTTNITINDFQPLCISSLPKGSTGQLKLDKYSGRVSYVYPSSVVCAPTPVEVGCISGAVNGPKLDQVVSASAGTFSDDWPYDPAIYVTTNLNPYENGRRGKWRQKASYVYKSDAVYRDKNYNTGTFQLSHFNWNTPGVNGRAGWLLAGNTEKISPHGDALQESNALGIKSSAKFGYRGAVPYLTAKNASYGSVVFEGFEKLYTNVFEEGFPLGSAIQDQIVRHSGNASLRLETGGNIPLKAIKFESPSEARPLLVKLWVRLSDWSFYGVGGSQLSSELKVSANGTTPVTMKVVARSNGLDGGSWALCEAVVDGSSAVDVSLMVNYSRSQRIWVDDVRVQPIDSEMNTYVYDIKTLRLLTVFDDQHFGVYYQYNAEGKLVRKMIETERGLKTLEETQYNTPVVTR